MNGQGPEEEWLLPLSVIGEVTNPIELGCGDGLLAGGDPSPPHLPGPPAAPASSSSGGVRSSRHGRSAAAPDVLVPNEELDQQRAQNRAKQARFRQRQREKQQELEQQYEATAADLERERQLNETMRLSGAVLEALKDQKEDCVAALEAAAAAAAAAAKEAETEAEQQQQQRQQRVPPQEAVVVEELPAQRPAGEATRQDSSTSGSAVLGADEPGSPQASASSRASDRGSRASDRGSGVAARTHAFDAALGSGLGRRFISLTFEERVEMCMRSLQRAADVPPAALAVQDGGAVDSFALSMPEKRSLVSVAGAQPQLLRAVLSMTAEDVLEDWGDLGEHVAEVLHLLDSGRIGQEDAGMRLRVAALYMASGTRTCRPQTSRPPPTPSTPLLRSPSGPALHRLEVQESEHHMPIRCCLNSS
ncbi:hypothetical protein ABPG75_006009 [Micractinium tetrahymenae]